MHATARTHETRRTLVLAIETAPARLADTTLVLVALAVVATRACNFTVLAIVPVRALASPLGVACAVDTRCSCALP